MYSCAAGRTHALTPRLQHRHVCRHRAEKILKTSTNLAHATFYIMRKTTVYSVLARAALLFARCCFAAAAVFIAFWLLFVGPLKWRIDLENYASSEAKALFQTTVLGNLLLRDLVFMWLGPAVLALSAAAVQVLQPMAQQQLGTSQAPSVTQIWASYLLPPR